MEFYNFCTHTAICLRTCWEELSLICRSDVFSMIVFMMNDFCFQSYSVNAMGLSWTLLEFQTKTLKIYTIRETFRNTYV